MTSFTLRNRTLRRSVATQTRSTNHVQAKRLLIQSRSTATQPWRVYGVCVFVSALPLTTAASGVWSLTCSVLCAPCADLCGQRSVAAAPADSRLVTRPWNTLNECHTRLLLRVVAPAVPRVISISRNWLGQSSV